MPRAALLLAIAVPLALLPGPGRAALIPRLDLTALCARSTDIVEANLTRTHRAGTPEWEDAFSTIVLRPIVGAYTSGSRIPLADALRLYNPARTGQRVLLFLARRPSSSQIALVDMRLIDTHSRVRRYFQPSNHGGLLAEGFHLAETGVQDDTQETKYLTFAAERQAIIAKWHTKKTTNAKGNTP